MSKESSKKYYIFEMNMGILNIVSLVLFILGIVVSFFLSPNIMNSLYEVNLLTLLALYVFWIILHEILHSMAYVLYGGDYKKIIYGAYLEKGVLYCLCKQNITRKNILNALMFPLFYIGIATYIIAIIFNLPTLLFLSIANISGAAGDIIMFIYISKLNKNIEFSEFDNPVQFAIYADEDVSKVKHFGLNYIKSTNTLKRENLKKVSISKGSIIAILIITVIIALSFIL